MHRRIDPPMANNTLSWTAGGSGSQIWQLETANADVEELARRRFKARRGAGGGAAWLDFIQGEMQLGLIPSCSDLDVIVR